MTANSTKNPGNDHGNTHVMCWGTATVLTPPMLWPLQGPAFLGLHAGKKNFVPPSDLDQDLAPPGSRLGGTSTHALEL